MAIKQAILKQFRQPAGWLGSLAGQIMAHRPSNIARNQWMIEQLGLQPGDRLLEIGYGPGLALEFALKKITDGLVVGIDHSEVMFRQASNRNKKAIMQGVAHLLVKDIERLPTFETHFNHICSANVAQFWRDPVAVLRHLRNYLAEDGRMTIMFMPRNKAATSQQAYDKAEQITGWLAQAGYNNIQTASKEFDGIAAVCVSAN